MKNCRRLPAQVLFVTLCLIVSAGLAGAQERAGNPAYSWLNGKWAGPDPLGGELQMDLKVVNDNQVQGSGVIPGAGRKGSPPRSTITGTVNGDKVELEVYYPGPKRRDKYRLSFVDGTLNGTTEDGFQATFKKLE